MILRRKKYKVKGVVWLYPGKTAPWHFFTVPKKESAALEKAHGECKRGWGSFPVKVMIGTTEWNTSIFPDRRSKTYILPLKAKVRNAEGIEAGDLITVSFSIDFDRATT